MQWIAKLVFTADVEVFSASTLLFTWSNFVNDNRSSSSVNDSGAWVVAESNISRRISGETP